MNKQELEDKLKEFTDKNSKVELQVVYKNNKTYSFMDTTINDVVQKEIFELLHNTTLKLIRDNDLLDFNPIGKEDNTNERLPVSEVSGYSIIKECRDDNNNFVDDIKDLKEINFYILEINNKNDTIKFFRRYSKSKSLSKGFKFKAFVKKFDKIDENIFQVDDIIDFIVINDSDIIVFNRYSFELVTNYKDNYLENLDKAMEEIEESNLIDNMDQFKEDCKNSMRIAKQFTKAMQSNSISLILNHLEQINVAIKEAELPIEFVENKFRYENKEQVSILVALLSDKYAKTLIGERITN